jgi:hypothetical protein
MEDLLVGREISRGGFAVRSLIGISENPSTHQVADLTMRD